MTNSIVHLCLALLTSGAVLAAQQPALQAPITSNPVVELKGKIEKVQIAPGQGMPFLEMRGQEGTVKVVLGSMRYLMQQNFSPKAGEEVIVKGYKVADQVVAASVTLPAADKTLRLRDENGRPLWMGGQRGRHGKRGPGGGRGGTGAGRANP